MHLKKIKFISLLFILVLSSCGDSVVSKTIYPFSTYLTMNFYNENNVDIDYIEDLINEYDKLADPYNSYEGINNVYTINNSSDFIEVDTKLYDLIKYSEDMRIKTSGYFNPLIGNLSLTWKNAIENKALPNEEIISQELEEISNSSLEFSDGKIKINGEANIDLGAITKGYVLNVLKDYLKENNISKYLINGGNS
ncbi:MAG: FAD:protein FMN transferase, partial [Bacilli bacterium]